MLSQKKPSKKPKALKTIEMEVAIAKYFGSRQNIVVPNISWGFMNHEADMFIIKKSKYAVEVEIKRTKSDLMADFKKLHKHEDNRIHELYYAIPDNLYESCKSLIPKHAGIITCERWYVSWEKKWSITVRTRRNPIKNILARKLTDKECLKIAHLGTMRIWNLKNKIIKLEDEKN
jgi:hypothetical protein